MRYLALLYAAEDERSDPDSDAWAKDVERYDRFAEVAGEAIVGGEALEPSREAVTIRYRGGGSVVTEGPYTEATEVIGGLYVLDADDLDAALDLARQIPAAEDGAVEVRPLVEWFQDQERELPHGWRRYLVLLAGSETEADRPGTGAWEAAVAEHARFGEEAGDAIVGGGALHLSETATTIRVRDGEALLADGPFPEATEVIGGLYLLAASSHDEAVALASRIPMDDGGLVEVRPVVELP